MVRTHVAHLLQKLTPFQVAFSTHAHDYTSWLFWFFMTSFFTSCSICWSWSPLKLCGSIGIFRWHVLSYRRAYLFNERHRARHIERYVLLFECFLCCFVRVCGLLQQTRVCFLCISAFLRRYGERACVRAYVLVRAYALFMCVYVYIICTHKIRCPKLLLLLK